MPKRNRVESLPKAVKEWLDSALVENGFARYQLLADELAAKGHTIGKSSLHRYGSKFEQRMAQLRVSSEQARAIVAASPDDDGAMNEALIRLTQDKIMGVLVDLEIDPESVDIAKLTRAIADLGRSSVVQKKWQAEVQRRVAAVATEVEQTTKAAGLSDATVAEIKRRILGIPDAAPVRAAA